VRERDLARTFGVVQADRFDEILVRLLRRAAASLAAQVADRGQGLLVRARML